jgi:outer membrane protein OmpA-like peptidoglycan-associated protein
MSQLKFACVAIVALLLPASAAPSIAQSIGYAQAIDRLGAACGKDIDKLCKKANLGGGRVTQCLDQNRAAVSSGCKASVTEMTALLTTRVQARAAVLRVCDVDIRRFCAGVQPGDGNLMECFYKARQNMSPSCQTAVTNAGYDAPINASAATTQVALGSTDLINSLQGVERAGPELSAARLRQMAVQSLNDPSRTNRMNRAPLVERLEKLAQLTIAIQFDFNSARIRPSSFAAVGLMADALYHPYLQGYRFLIVGHTDAKGNREYNLKLSQQRADAIRAALINPFGISPSRIEAVGLGEEQLLKPAAPEAAENRRVQLINIGPGR